MTCSLPISLRLPLTKQAASQDILTAEGHSVIGVYIPVTQACWIFILIPFADHIALGVSLVSGIIRIRWRGKERQCRCGRRVLVT
jgi:hypothetical protein